MAYNYEYEEYIQKKHNLRFDVNNAISKSERLKKLGTAIEDQQHKNSN